MNLRKGHYFAGGGRSMHFISFVKHDYIYTGH